MENKTENSLFDTANELYFKPVEGENGFQLDVEDDIRNRLVGLVEDRFMEAENARDSDETRWLKAYHNFRGLYGRNVKFRESEKSKVFVKVTKTKVLAAFGQLVDVIFGTGQFPIGITETRLPEGISTYKHMTVAGAGIEMSEAPIEEETEEVEEVTGTDPYAIGYVGDGKVLKAGATMSSGGSFFEEEIIAFMKEGAWVPDEPNEDDP